MPGRFNAGRIQQVPLEFGAGGHYQYAGRTGTLPATLAAAATLFALRNGAVKPMVLLRLLAYFQTLTVWTGHQEASFEAFVGRAFTANFTGGAAATLTGNNLKARTTMPVTGAADIRIATTAALGGGTVTPDTQPFAVGLGSPNVVNAAAGTAYSPNNRPVIDYKPDVANGEHPIVLAQDEGIVIKNAIVWPAAGTGVLSVEARWAEVDAFPDLS